MKITWLGHACFRVESKGYTVLIDPYADDSVPGLKLVRGSADLVLCSHEHGDHAGGRINIELAQGGENPFTVTVIDTYHDDVKGALRGKNKIHILDDGETKIAHLGDLGCSLKGEELERLKGMDVVLVPVGGFFTISGARAAELMQEIGPKVAVPMHYRSDAFGFPMISTAESFLRRMEDWVDTNSVMLDTLHLPEHAVAVLRPALLK